MRPFKNVIKALLAGFICFCCTSCIWDYDSADSRYLPLDDSEYPYAGIPRLVIETDDFTQIRNRENKIPSKLQVYGKDSPESEVLDLTVKGRGHSSFTMAKYSIKLKFSEKQSLFGMPADKEWDLISNQRDKSMLRNYITYQLAHILQDDYSPRVQFVELYLNRRYMGVYLLAEHIKVAKHRVNIPKTDSSFLFEKTGVADDDDILFQSHLDCIFNIKYPKDPTKESIDLLKTHVNEFEKRIENDSITLSDWIDIEDFVRYYWIQEFSKNIDGAFGRSIFITWRVGDIFRMGPVWDFDLAYGIGNDKMMSPCDWYVRKQGWYKHLFKNPVFKDRARKYWIANRERFEDLKDSINAPSALLEKAAKNEFKRWPTIRVDDQWPFVDSYKNYREAVDSLRLWIDQRVQWIDNNL